MPRYQGELDGLCGPYAVVNAFEHCGIDDSEGVFQEACAALAQSRWPNVLWEGTSLHDLMRMIKKCRSAFEDEVKIKIRYPFARSIPRSNVEYWKKFDEVFSKNPRARCAILGMIRPSYHWIVAGREEGSRLAFYDTDPHKPFQRKNRGSLHAGSRNGNPRKWIIDRSELILIEVE